MEISEMTNEQLEARSAEILSAMEAPEADLEELRSEAQQIREERELRAAEAQRQEIRSAIAGGSGNVIRNIEEENPMPEVRTYNASSPEYRSAWLKDIAVCNGRHLFGELNEEERAAFIHATDNTGAVVPTVTQNMIIELVEAQTPLYNDAQHTRFAHGFSIPRHKAIKKGDAKATKEGIAPTDDEQNEFDEIALDGVEIKKSVVITRKMQFQSIDAFEAWLAQEIADRIAVAKERLIMARLDGSAPENGSEVKAVGIDPANIVTEQTYDDKTIRTLFGKLKGTGLKVVYANSATIWDHLAGITGDDKTKLFVPNSMVDPIVQGRMYGATIKQDDNLADNVIYIGVKGSVLANDFIDIDVIATVDGKTANNIKLGYSLFDAGLKNPKGFVKATFTPGAAAAAAAAEVNTGK